MTLIRVSSVELETGCMGILGSPRRGSPRCADMDLRTSLLRKTHAGRGDESSSTSVSPKCVTATTTRFHPVSPKIPSDVGMRRTINTIAGTVLVMSVLVLSILLALAVIGPASRNFSLEPGASDGQQTVPHLLAEGLASLAASLDTDAVQEYVPPKGYIRKALEATKHHMEKQTEDITQLQAFYDAEVARLNQALEDQRARYEHKLLSQQEVLTEVFGDYAMPDN